MTGVVGCRIVWVMPRKKKPIPEPDGAPIEPRVRHRGLFGPGGQDAKAASDKGLEALGYKEPSQPKVIPELVVVEGEGLLGAIRHVLANHKAHDVTEEQRQARGWLRDDRAGFFREKSKLEQAEMVAKGEAKSREVGEDVGASASLELVRDLIQKFKESRHGV